MDELSEARLRYAREVGETAGLASQRLIRAFAEVAREDFVGPGPWNILLPENLWQYRVTALFSEADFIEEWQYRVEQAVRIIALNIVPGLFDLHPSRARQ